MDFTIEDIIKAYTEYGNLKDAAKALGTSRSTLHRRFKSAGYVYDPLLERYVLHETKNNVSRETLDDENLVPGSYTIPESLSTALKFKAVAEKRKWLI